MILCVRGSSIMRQLFAGLASFPCPVPANGLQPETTLAMVRQGAWPSSGSRPAGAHPWRNKRRSCRSSWRRRPSHADGPRFEHGVLFVTLPKNEAAKPRRISVNDLVNSPAIKKEQRTELDKPEVRLVSVLLPVLTSWRPRRNRCCLPIFLDWFWNRWTCHRVLLLVDAATEA